MTVGSLFSGIGGFDLGFARAGYEIAWQVECDPFCRKVLAARFPSVPCLPDVRDVTGDAPRVDVLVGGFPCQDLSVAGLRAGFSGGERSSLFFEFVRLIRVLQPSLWVIENVPGFLFSAAGSDFTTALCELDECGTLGSWRVLDSQYFGLAQRRERVFLVGGLGRFGRCAQQILFESTGGDGDLAASRETRAHVTRGTGEGVAFALQSDPGGTGQAHNTNYIASTLRGRSSRAGVNEPGQGGEDDENLVAFNWQSGQDQIQASGRLSPMLQARQTVAIVNALCPVGGGPDDNDAQAGHSIATGERERALTSSMHKRHDEDTDTLIATLDTSLGHHRGSLGVGDFLRPTASGVRRLTPYECEILQGFPPGWTCLCGEGHRGSQFCKCADTPRYKALGNAVSVPVAQWIAARMTAETEGVA
jgi:DNA (cytosine-5)-methyltransferase 1